MISKTEVIIAFVCLFIGAIASFYVTNKYFEAKIAKYQAAAQTQLAQAYEERRQKEADYVKKISKITDESSGKIDDINARYNALLTSLHADNTSDNNSLPGNTNTTTGTTANCECRCPAKDRTKLQKLYEQQLTIARDCDITATHYNELINIYNSIRN